MNPAFPLSAVVGQEEAKLALILAALDPHIGGVLLRGDKGSAKTTLARGLAALLHRDARFVELPVGATEDRLAGTLDVAAALVGGEIRFSPGLLAEADGGVLYVDEVNLLPDHLVDLVLDAAATGVNRVEREGISRVHASRFVLVGSMNPEEGDLRPQLLDRFGLSVEIGSALAAEERAEAVRRRMDFDADRTAFGARHAEEEARLAARVAGASPAVVPDEIVAGVVSLCASVGAHGLRADLTICRAAAALAGWEGRTAASAEDVRRVAPMALAHRARRGPFDSAGIDEEELSEAMDEHLAEGERGDGERGEDQGDDRAADADAPHVAPPARPATRGRAAAGKGPSVTGRSGRLVRDRAPEGPIGSVAVAATARRAAQRRAANGSDALVEASDLREAVRERKTASLVVFAVDASGSMGAARRMEAAKGAVLGFLAEAYLRRDLVALVAFRGDGAEVVLRPTGSVEVAKARLAEVPTGGRTPLAAGILFALEVATAPARASTHRPVLVLVTDGRATSGDGADPLEAAGRAADAVRRAGVEAVVVDAEASTNGPRLGLARTLAARMGARLLSLDDLPEAGLI